MMMNKTHYNLVRKKLVINHSLETGHVSVQSNFSPRKRVSADVEYFCGLIESARILECIFMHAVAITNY